MPYYYHRHVYVNLYLNIVECHIYLVEPIWLFTQCFLIAFFSSLPLPLFSFMSDVEYWLTLLSMILAHAVKVKPQNFSLFLLFREALLISSRRNNVSWAFFNTCGILSLSLFHQYAWWLWNGKKCYIFLYYIVIYFEESDGGSETVRENGSIKAKWNESPRKTLTEETVICKWFHLENFLPFAV